MQLNPQAGTMASIAGCLSEEGWLPLADVKYAEAERLNEKSASPDTGLAIYVGCRSHFAVAITAALTLPSSLHRAGWRERAGLRGDERHRERGVARSRPTAR